MDLFKILYPIEWVVAWIMVQFHALFRILGLNPASGAAWALSIVGLVVVIRVMLIPLFVRQIRASRGMQLLAPEMQAIQKKYKGKSDPASREAMSRETMELYKKHNTNPLASCLPILAQSPIFFALFRVLNSLQNIASGQQDPIGVMTKELASQAEKATLFGAPLSSTFVKAADLGSLAGNVRFVTILLIVAMSITTFTTQRQLTMKNMPASALQGPMAQQQKMLLYVLPLVFAFSGVNFPIGVLIYWTTTNVWSMGQQFYTIRRMPAPGSEAERMLKERQARKGKVQGQVSAGPELPAIEEPARGQRVQPKRKDRQRKRAPGEGPSTDSGVSEESSDPDDGEAGSTGTTKPKK